MPRRKRRRQDSTTEHDCNSCASCNVAILECKGITAKFLAHMIAVAENYSNSIKIVQSSIDEAQFEIVKIVGIQRRVQSRMSAMSTELRQLNTDIQSK